MMNGPFSKNYTKQQPSASSRSIPVQQSQQRSSPKVISVPIHFVSSDQPRTTMSMLRDSAVLKIQKVFRGFAVRKSVKKIASIGREVSEIERRIEDIEAVNLIRRDAKERLRVNETLMSLLFKLDSIRGVDCGIRDLRKAVTRKAIALQEKVDSIAQVDHQTLDSPDNNSGETDVHSNVCTSTSDQVTKASDSLDEDRANLEAIEDDEGEIAANEIVKSCNPVNVIGEAEAMETRPAENSTQIVEKDDDNDTSDMKKHKSRNNVKENREILENLMDDNEKMMKLMTQISERNEMQTRMINSLSRRVEQLEKALTTRKKKKTQESLRMRRRNRDKDIFCI
ncbi:hypothetical protein R6Q59_008374 [Mikania micrantha]|uniref:BAG domain-containing protein n=1 Tax=Mikania micrantha TaxID=192012 RepID=A0A5N6Q4J1_9ASTR|nr:hypothetical protein E3N88_02711 [Mikania micrantha]